MIYQIKSGARLAVSAQVAGEECKRLAEQGRLKPKSLVDESRPEDAPLHKCFEWNDDVAAEKWRETQAAYIIRSVEVTVEQSSEPTRAFVVTVSDGERTYKDIGYVLRSSESREALLDAAKRELMAFMRKYKTLSELSDVMDAIEGVVGSQQQLDIAV